MFFVVQNSNTFRPHLSFMIVFNLKAAVEGVFSSVRNFSCSRIEMIGNVQKLIFKVILKNCFMLAFKNPIT